MSGGVRDFPIGPIGFTMVSLQSLLFGIRPRVFKVSVRERVRGRMRACEKVLELVRERIRERAGERM
jgi:hypothetical protein